MRLIAIMILACPALLAACNRTPVENGMVEEHEPTAQAPEPSASQALPSVAAPLNRRDLLLAVAEAASDYAAGIDDLDDQRSLDGRPFALAIRFCEGDRGRLFQSSLDEEKGVLKLQVRPDLDQGALAESRWGPAQFEAVEGFWIPRPWLLEASCPATGGPPEATKAAPNSSEVSEAATSSRADAPQSTIGIAQFFEETSSRSRRRGGRPYEVTRTISPGTAVGPTDLLVEGRLNALPDGRTITCSGRSPAAPPQCIISVRIDKVSLRQLGGQILGTWGEA